MPKVIEAIYENGVFKPLEKIDIQEHLKIKIILPSEIEYAPQKECTLEGIIDIAQDCVDADLSTHHDRYLYREISARRFLLIPVTFVRLPSLKTSTTTLQNPSINNSISKKLFFIPLIISWMRSIRSLKISLCPAR